MRFPYLKGNESITLINLHPDYTQWNLKLPKESPRLAVDNRKGGFKKLSAKLYNVLIEPDESRITLVWTGFAKARRPYTAEELQKMPFLVEW